jgi:DNA-binding Xre family transcriptional regulator
MKMAARFVLSKVMDANGIGQSELAADTGLSFATIHRLYQDKTNQVSLETLDLILKALHRRDIKVGLDAIIDWKAR